MRAYWHHQTENFGDRLTPLLLERIRGGAVEWAPPTEAHMFGVGSIAEDIPAGYGGAIWGSGKMFAHSALDLSRARTVVLRGALTMTDSGARGDIVLGDPGLLCSLLMPAPDPVHTLGVVAHFRDPDLVMRFAPSSRARRRRRQIVVDIRDDPARVMAQVASCERVITSSLHALVLADALGIPSWWEPSRRVSGKGFKFRDYASALGERIEPSVWRQANARVVSRIQGELLDSVGRLP